MGLYMRISVKVKANAKRSGVDKISEKDFVVRVNVPPVDGKANEAVIKALAEYFDTPKSLIRIIRGHTAKQKIVDVG